LAGRVVGQHVEVPLLVVTGPPGSGKSTVAALVAAAIEPSVLVEGDAFFGFLASGAIEPWLPESAKQNEAVIEAAAAATGRFAASFETIYDGVVGPWFLRTFAAAADLEALDYVLLLPDVETCVRRVAERRGHGFRDDAATRKMHAEFVDAEVDPRHVVSLDEEPRRLLEVIQARRAADDLRWPG
jgi:cytidylate kinase